MEGGFLATNLVKSEAKFSFHLDGDSVIDAEILSNLIHNMVELTKLAAKEKEPEAYLKMNVTAFTTGSFQIDFSAICEMLPDLTLAATSIMELASQIVTIVKNFFEIKRLLKGKPPQKIDPVDQDTVKVTAYDGNSINVSKQSATCINNITAQNATINITTGVNSHNPNGGFTLEVNGKATYFSADDVKEISKPIPIEKVVNCKRFTDDTILMIKSPDLLSAAQWKFIYNGRQIHAPIEDDIFLEKIHNGVAVIKAKDCIKVTMEIYVDLDNIGNLIEGTEKYVVKKVHGDIFQLKEYPQIGI